MKLLALAPLFLASALAILINEAAHRPNADDTPLQQLTQPSGILELPTISSDRGYSKSTPTDNPFRRHIALHTLPDDREYTVFGRNASFFRRDLDDAEWEEFAASSPFFSSSSSLDLTARTRQTMPSAVDDADSEHTASPLSKKSLIPHRKDKVPFWKLPLCYQKCVNEKAWNTWHHIGDIRELTTEEFCHKKWIWVDNWIYHALQWCIGPSCSNCQPCCEQASYKWMHATCGKWKD